LLTFGCNLHPQETAKIEIKGRVVDRARGERIPNAYVVIHNNTTVTDTVVRSDNDGKWRGSIPPGVYNIFVASPGFAPHCDSFIARPREPITIKVILSPDHKTQTDRY
jgi:hypothetical protein